jgi:hypothetical protein
MKSFREMIDEYFEHHPEERKAIADVDIDLWLAGNADELIGNFSDLLARDLEGQQNEFVGSIYADLAGFHERLFKAWRAPLTRLDSLIAMCMEIGSEINAEYRSSEDYPSSSRRNITTRMHSRAVQVANEISCLLKGGYADGAMARWRSLHESTVILALLARYDDALSTRYVDYQSVIRFKAATEYNEHHERLGFEPFSSEDIALFHQERDAMVAKYGKAFAGENGWAAEAFKNQTRVTFKDIEKLVDLNHLRPQYGLASKNVHAGVDSIGFKLALSMSGKDILLAGPSNEGLIEPIQCTSYSLILATSELIRTSPHDERSIMEGVLWCWHEKLKIELTDAVDALRKAARTGASINAAGA